MPCYHPLSAWQCANGEVVFYEAAKFNIVRSLTLPCGRCIGCRLERARQWATRCMHEASLYKDNAFITLTYDDANLPHRLSLDYRHFQLFMKRFRKDMEKWEKSHNVERKVRFYMCGEYGPENNRPHFHACIFNWRFPDRLYWGKGESGEALYRSAQLERLWPYGFTTVGDVTFKSAQYIAQYCVQKVTGSLAKVHYRRVDEDGEYFLEPEFNRSSLKPGIGGAWIAKFDSDVYPHDFVIVNGHETKPAKYYDVLKERYDPEVMEEIKARRVEDARLRFEDNTDSRLLVKEQVAKARYSFKKRGNKYGGT